MNSEDFNLYCYRIHHDFGLAPNPFWGYLTLAVCKQRIRNNSHLKVGDWVVGSGSKQLKNEGSLIFAMKVQEILTFDEYWEDPRFDIKKPRPEGSLAVMYGDNFYHTDCFSGGFIQEKSAHSSPKFAERHLESDTKGRNVLISQDFYYFGDKFVFPPEKFSPMAKPAARGFTFTKFDKQLKIDFIYWLRSSFETGIHGDPISWREYLRTGHSI